MGLFGKKKGSGPAPMPAAPRPAAPAPSASSMQEVIFKMRYSSKTLGRQASKSEKQIAVEERKAKEALQKNNFAGARIYAENAIRYRSEALGYLKLQSQLEAVSAKLQSQQVRAQVSDDMFQVTQNLSVALEGMDMTKLGLTMEKFIQQSDDLELQTKYMDSAIGESTSSSTPQDQVDDLLLRIADTNDLELQDKIKGSLAPVGQPQHHQVGTGVQQQGQGSSNSLEARLAALQSGSGDGGGGPRL